MKFFNSKSDKDSEIKQKYGVIKTSMLKYITPTMIFVILMCFAIIFLNYDTLYENYRTNIPLNSLILLVFLFSMIEAFKNNINVYNTARFFKGMEKQIKAPVVNEEAVGKLKDMLDTSAYLINTQNTFKLVDNLQKYGHPLVTDNDARLIKSKLGFRVRTQRASISFMSGLLVMLGLIGTFWGLLLTIGSVGEAMDVIATQADSLGSSEGSGIGGIIQSISAPLQGMGLAFSSSLFGLAGSLVVGFFNYSCAQAQDSAIEDFSRWIDENIPSVGSEEEKILQLESKSKKTEFSDKANIQQVPQSGDSIPNNGLSFDGDFMKDLITQVLYTLKQSMELQSSFNENFENFSRSQGHIKELLHDQNEIAKENQDINSKSNQNVLILSELVKEGNDITKHGNVITEELKKATSDLTNNSDGQYKQILENQKILSVIASSVGNSNAIFTQMDSTLKDKADVQKQLNKEVSEILNKIPSSEYKVIGAACDDMTNSIQKMEKSLKENIAVMKDVAKEGNIERMARLLKEMQVFWLQMKQNAFEVVKKDNKKDFSD